jgi:hypothetical protein
VFVRVGRAKFGMVLLQFRISSDDAEQPTTDPPAEAKIASPHFGPTAHRSSSIANICSWRGSNQRVTAGGKAKKCLPTFFLPPQLSGHFRGRGPHKVSARPHEVKTFAQFRGCGVLTEPPAKKI